MGAHKFNPLLWGGGCRWLVTPLLSLMLVAGKGWWENLVQWDLSPLILSLLSAKTGDPSYKPAAQRGQEMLPHIHGGTSMLSARCGARPAAGHPCWMCSFPSLSSRPVSIQGRVDLGHLGFGLSTWGMLKSPFLCVKPCLV